MTDQEKLQALASEIGVESITLDQLISSYKTIRDDRIREESVRRAEYDAIRTRVTEETVRQVKEYGWFSAERLRNMTLAELTDLIGD